MGHVLTFAGMAQPHPDWLRQRRVIPELLDHADPDSASASVRDIRRINRLFGGHRVARSAFRTLRVPINTFLDVGAASGDMGKVACQVWPHLRVYSLDYRPVHMRHNPYERVVADAFALPFADRSIDLVFSSLFLHHFEPQQVIALLRESARVARTAVIAIDLMRHPLALYTIPATRPLLGWHPITVFDASASVASSFTRNELHDLANLAGLPNPKITSHFPWFRYTLFSKVSGHT